MRRAGLALAAVTLTSCGTLVPVGAGASGGAQYKPCASEDSVSCVWDGRHMGNGTGRSFYVGRDGRVWQLPHHVAHYLLATGERS